MVRQMKRGIVGLAVALALLSSGCGGGGGGGTGSTGSHQTNPTVTSTPTRTSTPVVAPSSRNQRTETSDAGSITLTLDTIDIFDEAPANFNVLLADPNGLPVANQPIHIDAGPGLAVSSTDGTTRADGLFVGSASGLFGGTWAFTASVTDKTSPFNGLSVTLTIVVHAPAQTPTPTPGGPTPVQTATATTLPCIDVQTIIVQTDKFNISSQTGGDANISAAVFDSNNKPVANVAVLFDVMPRIGTFGANLVSSTDAMGVARSVLHIPSNSGFGTLNVTASACGKVGTVTIQIVSGSSTKPVRSVVLQADPATVGSLSGGNVILTAAVLDSDNLPINDIDVLFITPVGKVSPLTDRTKVSGSQGGVASSVLQIPVGAINQSYTVSALAGGISGSTTITVVPGRIPPGGINPGVPPGLPANITLGASPTRIQVAGTGGTELATVIGRVFDNNGNPLAAVPVHYHVVAAQSAPGAVILPVTTPTPSGSPTPTTTLCALDDPVSVSDTAGFAVIQVRSGHEPGPVTVTACADTQINGVDSPLTETSVVVTVATGPAAHVGLTINSRFVNNNDGTLLTTLSAVVTDAQGNTVEDGTPVFFEVLSRQVCSGGANDGQSCATDASCSGGSCVNDPSDPSHDVVISTNATTNADPPCDTSQFSNQTGLPITPQSGDAITCIKYPTIQQGSEVVVRASVILGGVTNSQALTLPGRVGDLEVSVNPTTVSLTNASDGLAVVRAVVLDDNLDGVENVRVRFATSLGVIDKSALTNANGEANATLTIPAGTPSGNATLRIAAGGILITDVVVPVVNHGGGGGLTPTPGQPGAAAIRFVGAQPNVIGVRGSGLPEQSILTFQVTDALGAPASGVPVDFSLGRIADESIAPTQADSDATGNVQVTLTSGKRALSVQITAQVNTVSPAITTRSTAVTIVGGPPSQPNFSLAHQLHNISGRVTFGLEDKITAFVGDRFGNPVPPGTAVDFTTKGGVIGNPMPTTDLGQATATLVSQEPIPDHGTVVTLATTHGERPFIDKNGNGVCDAGDEVQPISEPFYDTDCSGTRDPDEDFIDLNGDGQFNADQGSGTPACGDQVVIFDNICTTFSGATNVLLLSADSGPIPANGSRDFTLIVSDNPDPLGNPGAGNPIVGGSKLNVSIDGNRGRVVGFSGFTLPDAMTFDHVVDGINRFQFTVVDKAPESTTTETDGVVVNVTSDPGSLPGGGNGSVSLTSLISFEAAPTPTPTPSPTPPPTPTPTPTPPPPVIAPLQAVLLVGTGALPTTCNGAGQTFVVTGGTPPMRVSAGGGCISTDTITASGGTFTYTAGNVIGDFTIVVTDAQAKTAQAGVRIQGPPTPTFTETPTVTNTPNPSVSSTPTLTVAPTPGAAFVKLDQILTHVTDNMDGTFTTILSALVTDQGGVVVGDDVPVQFSLVNPVAGVSVTSPGFTHEGPPQRCQIDFQIVLQPGDALSCLKYVAALQGTTILVRARAQTDTGTFVEDTKEIVLIDTRPTATPTVTDTPTVLATPTPTIQPPSIVPGSATLFAGVQPPPSCNGVSQVFVVNGGAPPFTLSASGGGCLNTAEVGGSGGAFTFTTGNQVGTILITATDALGRIATAAVTEFGPPAAFIDVDLFENLRTDNMDGSFESVATALITDANGATIPDGVPVEFSLVNPISGVSITSPSITNDKQPCTVNFAVQPQHGDALACIKYTSSRQGSTITIRARVTTATGAILSADRTVTLPDTRPTPTQTATATLTSSSTPTITLTPTPFPSGVATFTPTATSATSPTPPVGSIQFIGADPVTLGVRGSGKPEQSLLTFVVKDTTGKPISGVSVTFTLSGTGTESLNPVVGVTDLTGTVITTVTSGTRAATVRVRAGADTNGDLVPDVFAQSIGVSILGAPPTQNRFSIAPRFKNIPGRRSLGLNDPIGVFANDRFGNAVPLGTAISFVSNGASVVSPSTTDINGQAQATLLSEQVVPPSGIVTVMAFTLGEESFLDNNGDGGFDPGDTIITDDIPEPFIDVRPLPPLDAGCSVAAPSPLCNGMFDPATPFELFLDTPPLDGKWGTQGTHGMWDNNIFVSAKTVVTFSGSPVQPVFDPPGPFAIPDGGSLAFTVDVHDDLGNPLKGGLIQTTSGFTFAPAEIIISDTAFNSGILGSVQDVADDHSYNQPVDGLTRFHFVVFDEFPGDSLPPQPVQLSISVNLGPDGIVTFLGPTGTVD
jgi:hypothetical protein